MKTCSKCKKPFDISLFYFGRGACKKCYNIQSKAYYRKNRNAVIKQSVEHNKEYRKTKKGKAVRISSLYKYRENHRAAHLAHLKISERINTGRLERLPCKVCGTTEDVHAHHDNYSNPLEIDWLCRKHHVEWHKNNKAINSQ